MLSIQDLDVTGKMTRLEFVLSTIHWCQNLNMALEFTTSHIEDSIAVFRQYKGLAEKAMAQVTDEALQTLVDNENNSIALIVKHMAGNMRSRWTDFLTTDGEKPDRNRDSEFEDPPQTREELMALWESGWKYVFDALGALRDEDLHRTVKIRGEAHSVLQAINRQLCHYPYHCGQIVLLAKHFGSDNWKALTVPRGQSAAFNQMVAEGKASQR